MHRVKTSRELGVFLNGMRKCKRQGCSKPSAKLPQVYCSRDCAPYGYYSREYALEVSAEKKRQRAEKAAQQRKTLENCADLGMDLYEASAVLGLALNTTAVYCRRWQIQLKKKNRS